MRRALRAALALALAALPSVAGAWTADEPWRTVETEHFRIHYPLDTEAWALDLAARIDPMRERVAGIVGWQPDTLTELVVLDPWSAANGFALPFARGARIGVFPTAPPASSGIGNYRLWGEDLQVHEDAHVVHLSRTSRNPMEKVLFEGVLGVPAIAIKSPAWVIEGYATLVEGELTGQGRPNSDSRATFLRMLAREGQLPTYGELDGSSRWRGRSMRYLVGSAYLEWLAARYGDDRLPELWARMTARERRSFEEAFQGSFGASAPELYGRFVAELTAEALAVEPEEGAAVLWMDLSGEVEPPALSPDGTRIAVVSRHDKQPTALVVYETAVDTEAEQERADRLAELLEADPEDVAPVGPRAAPHKEVARRVHPPHRPRTPRFVDDHRLLYSAWVSDPRGVRQPDLFEWDFEAGRTRRITRNANLREAAPCGGEAVAVRRQHGLSSLVRVDLASGETSPLTLPSPTLVDADPRLDDACATVSWLRHDGHWRLMVAPLDTLKSGGEPVELALPEAGQILSVDLSPDGTTVVAAIGTGGFVDLWERPIAPAGTWTRRTHLPGGANRPEVAPGDGGVYFLSSDPRGFDLLHLPASAPAVTETSTSAETHGAVRPPPVTDAPALPEGPAPTPSAYGLGPHKLRLLLGARVATAGDERWEGGELGLHIGDLIGRSEGLLQVGVHGEAPQDDEPKVPLTEQLGARASWTWRRLPVHLSAEGWWLAFDEKATGGGATADLHRRWSGGGLEGSAGGYAEAQEEQGVAAAGVTGLSLWDRRYVGETALGWSLSGGAQLGDRSRAEGTLRLRAGWRQGALLGSLQQATAFGDPLDVRRLQPGVQPDLRTAGVLWWPSLPSSVQLTDASRLRGDLRVMGDLVGVYGESVRASDTGPWTFVGLDLDAASGAQPIATLPAIRGSLGAACQLGSPDGLDLQACRSDEAWSVWLNVTVEPGRPPAYPHEH